MPKESSLKQQLRERFNYRCGYCGIREVDHGSELEIEHFQQCYNPFEFESLVVRNTMRQDYWYEL